MDSYSYSNGSSLGGGRRGNGANGYRVMDQTGYHNQQQSQRQSYTTDPHLSDFLNRPGKVIVKDLFSSCTPSAGGCGGYHPGTPQTCWFKPGHINSRIPEAIFRGYVAGTRIPHPSYLPEGIPHVNPIVQPGDTLEFCILTKEAQKQLKNVARHRSITLKVSRDGDNLLIVDPMPTANLPNSKSTSSFSTATKHDNTQMADGTAMQHDNTQMQDDNLLQSIDKQIEQAQHELKLQEKKDQLVALKKQLQPEAPDASGHDKQSQSMDGIAMLSAAHNEGKHITANVGSWLRSSKNAKSAKWTNPLVDSLLGATTMARLGFWYVYSSIYSATNCTEELMTAFTKPTTSEVTKALKEEKLAIQDIRDTFDKKLTGDIYPDLTSTQ